MVELVLLSHWHWWSCGYVGTLRHCDVNFWQIVSPIPRRIRHIFGIPMLFRRSHYFYWVLYFFLSYSLLLLVNCGGVRGTRNVPLIHRFHSSLLRVSTINRAIDGLIVIGKWSSKVFHCFLFLLFLTFALDVDVPIIKFIFHWHLVHVILLARGHWLFISVSFGVISLLRENWVIHQVIMDQLFLERCLLYLWVLRVINILEFRFIILLMVINLICHREAFLMRSAAWLR